MPINHLLPPNLISNLISTSGTPISEIRKALGLSKKDTLKSVKWLEDNGYLYTVTSQTGKIKCYVTDKDMAKKEGE